MPKHGATIMEIDDIGAVKDDVSDGSTTVYDAEVVGVPLLESYPACFGCKSKVAPTMVHVLNVICLNALIAAISNGMQNL